MHLRQYQKEKEIRKTAVATVDLIVNKIAHKITRISSAKPKSSKSVAGCVAELPKDLEFNVKKLIEIPKER